MPDDTAAATATAEATAAATATEAPLSDKLRAAAEGLEKDIKASLEYEIVGKHSRVTVQEKRLTIAKWGMRKHLQLGSRVIALINKVKMVMPGMEALDDVTMFAQMTSYVAEDVMDIVAESISEPFKNRNEALEWLDNECALSDLFDLAFVVYDMNFKSEEGNGLGKQIGGLEKLAKRIQSLSTSSSKS